MRLNHWLVQSARFINRKMRGNKGANVQHRLDFETLCAPLASVTESTGVPLTCVLLYSGDHIYQKTLIRTSTSSLTPAPPQVHTTRPSESSNPSYNGVPEALINAKDVDATGGKTMFAIGSIFKPLLALTCCIIIEEGIYKNLTWDTKVFQLANTLFEQPAPVFRDSIPKDPTLEDVLLHYNSLPSINQFLFLADGTFQMNDEDFVAFLNHMAYESSLDESGRFAEQTDNYEYSNANYILIAILLQKISGVTIAALMKEHLLKPLGMDRTLLDIMAIDRAIQDPAENIAQGQRVSGDLSTCRLAPRPNYTKSTASLVSVGVWSCTSDLAKLYVQLCKAAGKKSELLSSTVAARFFCPHRFETGPDVSDRVLSFAGLVHGLNDRDQGQQSLNRDVKTLSQSREKQVPRKPRSDKNPQDKPALYYKGGTSDGFTATVYLYLRSPSFAIVLSNSAGPVDITEPIARYLLQSAVNIEKGSDPIDAKDDLEAEMPLQIKRACSLWRNLEFEDADYAAWSDDVTPFVGSYVDKSGLELQITDDAQAWFKRRGALLTTMKIGARDAYLRLFSKEARLFIDRVTCFHDLRLKKEQRGEKLALIPSGYGPVFVKK